MSTRDLVQEALHSLEANKGRSLLTILGIVIGIASVIAMTSLIGGIQNSLVNSLGLNAARMVQIYSSQELTESDVEKLRKMVPQIEQVGIVDSAYTEYKAGDKSYTVMAQGVDSDMLDAVGASKLVAGRTYTDTESQSGARVALISRGSADQLYGNEQDALGKTIKVSNGEVQIVGVIDGGSDSMGSLTLYMPRETISGLFGDENPSFPSVTALAVEGTDMDELCKTIESKVRAMKSISEDDEYDLNEKCHRCPQFLSGRVLAHHGRRCQHLAARGRHRNHEHDAHQRDRTHPRDRHSPRAGRKPPRYHGTVLSRVFGAVRHRRHSGCRDWLSAGMGLGVLCRWLWRSWRARRQRNDHAELFDRYGTPRFCRLRRHWSHLRFLPRPPSRKTRPRGVPEVPVTHPPISYGEIGTVWPSSSQNSPYFTATYGGMWRCRYSKRDSRLDRPLIVRSLATADTRSMGTEPSESAQVR